MHSTKQNLFMAIRYADGFFKIGLANWDGVINLADLFIGEVTLQEIEKFTAALGRSFGILGIELAVKYVGTSEQTTGMKTLQTGKQKRKRIAAPKN